MAFPTTSVIDNFNRANAGPPPSADWSQWNGRNQFTVNSNTARAETGTDSDPVVNYWDTSTFGADSEAYISISGPNLDGNSSYGVLVRLQTGDVTDGYLAEWTGGATIDIYRIDSGSYTQLGASNTSQTLDAGDSLGLEIIGSTLKVYKNEGGGWSQVGTSRSDTTYSAAGYIGLHCYQSGTTLIYVDDFGGGTVAAAGKPRPVFQKHTNRVWKRRF